MGKLANKANREKNIPVMEAVCKRLGVTVQPMNQTFHFRLRKKGYNTIDYYPTKNKVFFLEDQSWGEIPEGGLEKFLQYQFDKKENVQ